MLIKSRLSTIILSTSSVVVAFLVKSIRTFSMWSFSSSLVSISNSLSDDAITLNRIESVGIITSFWFLFFIKVKLKIIIDKHIKVFFLKKLPFLK